MWSVETIKRIHTIRKKILRTKILLTFMIDIYAWWDNAFRWGHITIATLTPVVGIILALIGKESQASNIITIVLGTIVAGMLKIKEYIKFDKIRDVSKSQSIKYTQLYDRIDRELIKNPENKQQEDDFMYWITREYNNLHDSDPDISYSNRKKFEKYCKEKNIHAEDDDIEQLANLMIDDAQTSPLTSPLTSPREIIIPVSNMMENTSLPLENTHPLPLENTSLPVSNMVENTSLPLENTSLPLENTSLPVSKQRTLKKLDREYRKKYKATMKKMDTKADLEWTLERMKNLG